MVQNEGFNNQMGYTGPTGNGRIGFVVPNNGPSATGVVQSALGKFNAVQELGSGVYVDAPALLATCVRADADQACDSASAVEIQRDGGKVCCMSNGLYHPPAKK